MDIEKIEDFIGIDVAKDTLAVYFPDKKYVEIWNTSENIEKYFKDIDKEKTLVVMEGTGGYEYTCLNWLLNHDIKVFRTSGKNFREYKNSIGRKAKTDKIDAKLLAEYGQWRKEVVLYQPKESDLEKLRETISYLDQLKKIRAAEKNRLKSPGLVGIKAVIEKTIRFFDENIGTLEQDARDILKKRMNCKGKLNCSLNTKGSEKRQP